MKILVTGGAGFIGSHIVDRLAEKGHDVVVLDNLDKQVHHEKPNYLNKKAEYVFGDVRDENILKNVLEDVEIVFHEASAVGVGQSMYEIKKYVDVNSLGTANLLDVIVNGNYNIKKIIVASSMSIYGEGSYKCDDCETVYPELREKEQLEKKVWEMLCPICKKIVTPIPTSEEKPLKPTSIYAITKKDQEEMFLTIGRAYGIPAVALRYFNVFGPRQSLNNPYTGVAAIFSSRIKNENPPIIFEDGLQSRDFISVHDIVQANMIVMEKNSADYNSFNIGTGKPVSIKQIADTLTKLYGKKIQSCIIGKFREGDIRHCFAEISKIKRLGFSPSVSFEDGMKELVLWGGKTSAKDMSEIAIKELENKGLSH